MRTSWSRCNNAAHTAFESMALEYRLALLAEGFFSAEDDGESVATHIASVAVVVVAVAAVVLTAAVVAVVVAAASPSSVLLLDATHMS